MRSVESVISGRGRCGWTNTGSSWVLGMSSALRRSDGSREDSDFLESTWDGQSWGLGRKQGAMWGSVE